MITNELTKTLERVKGIPADYTVVAGHTLRAIDLVFRIFCKPFADNVVATSLTSPDFQQLADVNHVEYRTAALDDNLQLTADTLLAACNARTRLVWLSMPNAVTSNNNMVREELVRLLDKFTGMVVVDERLSDYARQRPLRFELPKFPRLIVLDSPGLLFSQPANIGRLRLLEALYEYDGETLSALPDPFDLDRRVRLCMQERTRLMQAFRELPFCERVYDADADFFVVSLTNAPRIVAYLQQRGITLDTLPLPGAVRIPVGTRSENNELVGALRQL